MYEIIKSNWHKTKIIASFGIAITLLILMIKYLILFRFKEYIFDYGHESP